MSTNPSIHPHPSELIAATLAEHVDVRVTHSPQGAVPRIEQVPTIAVRPLLAPPPTYSRVGGWHVLTVQFCSTSPGSTDDLLDLIPNVHRGAQLAGPRATVVQIDMQSRSKAIVAGVMQRKARARVIVAERVPALQGIPFDSRLRAEAKRISNRAGAVAMVDVLHGTSVDEHSVATTTLQGALVFPVGSISPGAAREAVEASLTAQKGWSVEAVGTVSTVAVDEAVAVDQTLRVPVSLTYRGRVPADAAA